MRQLELFFIALAYFTRLPVPGWVAFAPEKLGQAARFLPLVGWLVAAIGAAVFWLAAQVLPVDIAVVLSMAATVRVTGAFHEDGWADTCDGLGGGWTKARVLEIMKDSRIGSFGAIGLVLLLLANTWPSPTSAPSTTTRSSPRCWWPTRCRASPR
jgi:adenosylcobinamide-GDP ribazoletransferase